MPAITVYVTHEVYAWLCTKENTTPGKAAQIIINQAHALAHSKGGKKHAHR